MEGGIRIDEIGVGELKRLLRMQYLVGERDTKLILGPPGIGKSVMVRELAEELAEELGKEFIEYSDDVANKILEQPEKYFVFCDIRLTEVEPADLIGIPREVNGEVMYKPLMWGRVMSKCAGILFLDEITNVQRLDVQAAMYKLLLDRKVGFLKLHKDVMVIAAGNEPEHSAIATELPAPAINRVDVYRARATTPDEWATWMNSKYGDEWDKRVYAFLKKNSRFFIERPQNIETLEQFATPRRWTSLALITKDMEVHSREFEYIVKAKVGQQAGTHFIAFARVPSVEPEKLIKNPEIWLELKEESKYMSIVQLVTKMNDEIPKGEFAKYKKFILMLLNNDREFMSVLLTMLQYNVAIKLIAEASRDNDMTQLFEYIKSLRSRVLSGA